MQLRDTVLAKAKTNSAGNLDIKGWMNVINTFSHKHIRRHWYTDTSCLKSYVYILTDAGSKQHAFYYPAEKR